MNSTARKTLTLVGMGLMAGAAVGMTSTAASASVVSHGDHGPSSAAHHDSRGGWDDRGDRNGGGWDNGGDRNGGGWDNRGDRNGGWDDHWDGNRARTYSVGFVKGRQACETAARIGEWRGYWDQGTCYRTGSRNVYLLQATDYQGRHRHM